MTATAMVIWFTGLPASGKSTLAELVRKRLEVNGCRAVVLDSDALRPVIAPGRGYQPDDRSAFYQRLAELAGRLAHQGRVVLVAATAPLRAHRQSARALAPRFAEVFVDVPLAECERRDRKGLYAKARAGLIPEFTGISDPYEPPGDADLVLDTSDLEPADAVAAVLDLLVEGGWVAAG
jgi:sulfate adenylyltransferase